MPSPPTIHPSVPNGTLPSAPLQNGNAIDSDTSSKQSPLAVINGSTEKAQAQNPVSKTSLEENKQRAKVIMATEFSGNPSSIVASPDGQSPLESSDVQLNGGAVQARKRSRSGTRMPQSSNRHDVNVPVRTKEIADKIKLEQLVNRELVHTAAIITVDGVRTQIFREKLAERDAWKKVRAPNNQASHPGFIHGPGYAGYGHRFQDSLHRKFQLVFPKDKKRYNNRISKSLRVSKKDLSTQAEQVEELVPIRLDIEWDKIRLRDTFTWNVHDRVVEPKLFAETLVEDLRLPLPQYNPLVQQIEASIKEQIQEFHPHIYIEEEALDPHLPYSAYKNDEMRILIKLNITVGQHTLVDQFEWDINNPLNAAEEFARQMTHDLSLSGEFTTAIAHSIREQAQLFTRSLYVVGHPFDGRPIEDHELAASFLPSPLPSPFRPYQAAKDFTPYLYELNELELEKTELSLSRDERRQKRSVNRRGGPALPDLKDRRRTNRTLLVSSVLAGAVDSIDESRLFKRTTNTVGKGRRGQARDGFDDSDESDSDESTPDSSIPPHLLSGTARTRGMRGAASAAQAAMRANTLGRSATPESSLLHHETRVSGRRIVRDDSSPELQTSLIVKLRLPRQRFQQLLRDMRAKSKDKDKEAAAQQQAEARATPTKPSVTPQPSVMGPPATTPRVQNQALPAPETPEATSVGAIGTTSASSPSVQAPQTSKHGATSSLGRVDATGPPGPDHPIVSQFRLD